MNISNKAAMRCEYVCSTSLEQRVTFSVCHRCLQLLCATAVCFRCSLLLYAGDFCCGYVSGLFLIRCVLSLVAMKFTFTSFFYYFRCSFPQVAIRTICAPSQSLRTTPCQLEGNTPPIDGIVISCRCLRLARDSSDILQEVRLKLLISCQH